MGGEKNETRLPVTEIVSQVEETHRRIRSDLEVLDKSEDLEKIVTVVEELPELLKEHFRDEEKPGGLFDELRSLRPVFESQIKFLRREHEEIMEALARLHREIENMEDVHRIGDREQHLDHIRMSAASFLDLIRHHERIESRLVAETYYSEDGGSG